MNKRLKTILIRLLYIVPLIIFIIGLFNSLHEFNSTSSLGIKYKYVFIIPTLIFTYQSIRNSIVGWILVMTLYFAYLTIWVYGLIDEFPFIGLENSFGQYFSWWILVLIYLGLGWVYYKFRPKTNLI